MKEISILNAFSRETVGSNSSKKVRGDNKIPAIIYGDGKKPPTYFFRCKGFKNCY